MLITGGTNALINVRARVGLRDGGEAGCCVQAPTMPGLPTRQSWRAAVCRGLPVLASAERHPRASNMPRCPLAVRPVQHHSTTSPPTRAGGTSPAAPPPRTSVGATAPTSSAIAPRAT
jgi:hypothetical protein